jgi:hypothetical protein
MDNRRYRVFAPLQDFMWDGDDLELAPGLWIKRFSKPPDLEGMEKNLAKPEWERVLGADHWLVHESAEGSTSSATEVENLVLLSLWTVKATRAHIIHRFKLGIGEAEGNRSQARLLDRFQWTPGYVDIDIDESDLRAASGTYAAFAPMCQTRGRLNDALLLTLAGCWAYQWQVSLICHAAAAEAILTYATGSGITRRLATSFACLTENDPDKRDAAYREFTSLYSDRSNIMHGRTYNVAGNDRLPTMVRFQGVLRKLWVIVCASPALSSVLEGSDAQRQAYFQASQLGYAPPSIP